MNIFQSLWVLIKLPFALITWVVSFIQALFIINGVDSPIELAQRVSDSFANDDDSAVDIKAELEALKQLKSKGVQDEPAF